MRDEGRGIDPADVDLIFEEFHRGRLAEEDGGTGLGLASVRELVQQQDGTVHLQSEVGVGTTVTVELPVEEVPLTRPPSQRDPNGRAAQVRGSVAIPAPTGHPSG